MANIFKGILGLGKAGLGIDTAPATLIHQRREVCRRCRHNVRGKCAACRCYLVAKTKLRSEKCPRGHW